VNCDETTGTAARRGIPLHEIPQNPFAQGRPFLLIYEIGDFRLTAQFPWFCDCGKTAASSFS